MLGMWGGMREIYEIRNKKQQEDSDGGGASSVHMPTNVNSMLNMAKSMQSGSFKVPKMPTKL
jgi:hypothetical protein